MKYLLVCLTLFSQQIIGQVFHHTIKYNVSNPLIFGTENILIGYERITKPNQTLSVNVGLNRLPSLNPQAFISENGRLNLLNSKDNGGYHLSFEYRFYLQKENKYPAPRGIYVSPYYSFNNYSKNNSWDMKTLLFNGNLNTNFNLNIHTIGAEMGYQFVIRERYTLDLTFLGLGIGNFNVKESSNSELNLNDRKFLFEKVRNILEEKVPGFNLTSNSRSSENTGDINTSRLNLRFMIQVGYRF